MESIYRTFASTTTGLERAPTSSVERPSPCSSTDSLHHPSEANHGPLSGDARPGPFDSGEIVSLSPDTRRHRHSTECLIFDGSTGDRPPVWEQDGKGNSFAMLEFHPDGIVRLVWK
jgi:hypothetical protein